MLRYCRDVIPENVCLLKMENCLLSSSEVLTCIYSYNFRSSSITEVSEKFPYDEVKTILAQGRARHVSTKESPRNINKECHAVTLKVREKHFLVGSEMKH